MLDATRTHRVTPQRTAVDLGVMPHGVTRPPVDGQSADT